LQPRVRWFSRGLPLRDVEPRISDYIAATQHGHPNTLVQLALFRIFPRGEDQRTKPMTAAEVTAYKAWMRRAAAAIDSARVAVVLEPDLAELAPPARTGAPRVPDAAVRESLVAYAARLLSALPRTTVYLDAGDADWLSVDKAVTLLRRSGVRYARGFALGATHYSSVRANVVYAKAVAVGLAEHGLTGKHAVLDTADNGRGFTWPYWHTHRQRLGNDFDNARICASRTTRLCDTLGLPPTWRVTRRSLGTAAVNRAAATYVDGFLWFGRPWLDRQAAPYDQSRALRAARSTPYGQVNITGGRAQLSRVHH